MGVFSGWSIDYRSYDSQKESLREALCTLGNGYFCTRGASPEVTASKIHYPGTYIAGLYNRLTTHIAGRDLTNEDLVNCPNWLYITFKIENGEWFGPSSGKVLSYRQTLNMKEGILTRIVRVENWQGQRTKVVTRRIVHMGRPHIGALEYIIIPENYNGRVTVRAMLDGSVINYGVARYRQLNSKHWKVTARGKFSSDGVYLTAITIQSRIKITEASRIRLYRNSRKLNVPVKVFREGGEIIGQELSFFAEKKKVYRLEKIVAIYTSRDKGIHNPEEAAIREAKLVPGFSSLFKSHKEVWRRLWNNVDIEVGRDLFTQTVLRLHIFHLLQVASHNTSGLDVGLPARGLHGEAYRGHIFWDEIFAMHFYDFHLPSVSRALLMYRYRRLKESRRYARINGYRGAMFPWQSASSGREETQEFHLNPLSGKWGPDYSRLQRHVSFAIAYNVWNYYERTADEVFFRKFGAEIILSIAQFASSLVYFDPRDRRYHTSNVMGPDEFHEKYPNSSRPGLKDNAYTNFMIVWVLLKGKETLDILPSSRRRNLLKKLGIREREIGRWDDIIHRMKIIINREGIISQFDGYFRLKDINWEYYIKKYGNIHRMDRILKAEGRSPDAYKVTKQADVLMIFYLFPFSEVKEIFKKMGYKITKPMLRKNYNYYLMRTSHGSTLSKVVHCFIAHQLGHYREARNWFREVLKSDVYDTQGGTTPEGIHVGVMGGSLDIVLRAFCGFYVERGEIKLSPSFPDKWRYVNFNATVRGMGISFEIKRRKAIISLKRCPSGSKLSVDVKGKLYSLTRRRKIVVAL